jgi:hypothetical protein
LAHNLSFLPFSFAASLCLTSSRWSISAPSKSHCCGIEPQASTSQWERPPRRLEVNGFATPPVRSASSFSIPVFAHPLGMITDRFPKIGIPRRGFETPNDADHRAGLRWLGNANVVLSSLLRSEERQTVAKLSVISELTAPTLTTFHLQGIEP